MKKLMMCLTLLCLTAMLAAPASALECVNASSISLAPPQAAGLAHSAAFPFPTKSYDFAGTLIDAPGGPEYAKPTSVEPVVTADRGEALNQDLSKNASLVPPTFGSPTSYVLGVGDPLTPNLTGTVATGLGTVISDGGASLLPPVSAGTPTTSAMDEVTTVSTGYTTVTSDLYYANGSLGTLKIPSLGVNVKVVQGTDSAALAKGAGHFEDTSIWDGNVCVAGHNRGTNCYFGEIHTLDVGDKITLTTKLGTRTYRVVSVLKIRETDNSMLAPTADNRITLYTCVRDQSAYRWCVQAVEAD